MEKIYKIMTGDGQIVESKKRGRYGGWYGKRKGRRIFGRLDCKSGMRMKKESRTFFHTWNDAIAAGFRPCKNCRPTPNDTY